MGKDIFGLIRFLLPPLLDSTLDVTVKRVAGDIVSNYIKDIIKIDDVIEVKEPFGGYL